MVDLFKNLGFGQILSKQLCYMFACSFFPACFWIFSRILFLKSLYIVTVVRHGQCIKLQFFCKLICMRLELISTELRTYINQHANLVNEAKINKPLLSLCHNSLNYGLTKNTSKYSLTKLLI